MPYLSELMERDTQPQNRLLWAALGVLVAAQLFAFWLLCSHQVRKAEARQSEAVVQQMALADCLQYIPGSTIASCTRGPVRAAAHAQNGAVPVSYTYR